MLETVNLALLTKANEIRLRTFGLDYSFGSIKTRQTYLRLRQGEILAQRQS